MSTTPVDGVKLQYYVRHLPQEVERMLDEIDRLMPDRHGHMIHLLDRVVTPAGEVGVVIRLDKNTRRVLLRVEDTGRVRLLRSHRLEVRQRRPRPIVA